MRVVPSSDPANVIVAPNSPRARAKASTEPESSPGSTTGTVTRHSVVSGEAPRVAATASYRSPAVRSAPSSETTRNGMATKVWASTTAVVEKGTVMPNSRSRKPPTGPVRPSRNSSVRPPTTGGSTSGSSTTERTSDSPGSDDRASTTASGPPNSRHSTIVATPVFSESQSAASADGDVTRPRKFGQSTRRTSPATGTATRSHASAAGAHRSRGTGPGHPRRSARPEAVTS